MDPRATVSKFIARWVASEKLDVTPSLVTLRLVKRGPAGLPSAQEEADALDSPARLLADPSATLAQAGVTDGSWLVAEFARGGEQARESSALAYVAESVAALQTDVGRLTSLMERLAGQVSHDTTPAALGDKTLAALRVGHRVEDFGGGDGEAVLTAEEQNTLSRCLNETEVVKFLTPFLWNMRVSGDVADPCRSVLVNSENLAWLDNLESPLRDMRLKPDLFVAPGVCVLTQPGTEKQGSGACFLFGRLADARLQRDGCVRELYEAKLGSLTLAHFGELVMYHRLIPGECRGMLFSDKGFWLYSSYDASPVALVRSAWTTGGSAERLRRFFDQDAPPPPPLLPLLRHLLTELGVRPVTAALGTAFLGSGGSGRVFAVEYCASTSRSVEHARSKKRMALKVVPAGGKDGQVYQDLTTEFNALTAAADRGAPVVQVVADSFRLAPPLGGGFLLGCCGQAFNASASADTCADAFLSLAELHERGVLHGDARVANLVSVHKQPMWIDLASAVLTGGGIEALPRDLCQQDARTLATSVLLPLAVHATTPHQLPPAVEVALEGYDSARPSSVATLASAVWAAAATSDARGAA